MRKILVLGVCLIGILSADWKRVMGSSDVPLPPEKEVMKSDTLGVFIRTAVFGFTEQDTTVDNKDFKHIEIPEEPIDRDTTNAGKPQIPYIRLLIAVPDSCDFNITVYESDYTLFEDYLIYPIPRIIFEEDTFGCFGSREVYSYDASFYEKDTLYPDKFYEVNSDGHWRDQRVLEVFLYPVQFNPKQKMMYFYTGLDLRIEYSGEVFENENGLGPFEDIGREILLNYSGIDWEPESVPEPAVHYYTKLDTNNVADYIIVTHLDFINDGIALYWIDQFAQWRVDHNQYDVGIVKMMDVYKEFLESPYEDSAKALRDFLIYAYNNWYASSMPDNHFAYCLFIGDWDYVPTLLFTYHNPVWLGANEFYFAELNSDNFADIMLGRWPVKQTNVQDLITIAQKTINYEKYPVIDEVFRRTGLLIAGDTCFETDIDSSKSYFSDIGYDTITIRPSQIDQGQPFIDSVNKYLNQGEILTSYFGHGGPDGWMNGYDTTQVKDLTNSNRLPVVLSNACLTAMFQWDHPFYRTHSYTCGTCLGEFFLFNPNGGAVAFWGATTYSFMPNYKRVLKMLLRYQHWILGEFTYIQGSTGNMWCLLGDPALDLGDYTAFPDLPDLVVRPQGTDISPLAPYPYPSTNDVIPIEAKIWNIGGTPAYDVDVKFEVVCEEFLVYNTTVTFDEIKPRCLVDTTVYWNTALTHPDYLGEIGDCEFWVKADPNDVIEESWPYNNQSDTIKKVILYPPGWSKKCPYITSHQEHLPALANLDAAGTIEIVYPGLDSVYIFEASGNNYRDWPKYFREVYGVVLADIDDNGYIDIVAVSKDSIKAYFNNHGNITLGWCAEVPDNYEFTGLPAIGYIQLAVIPVLDVVMTARKSYGTSSNLKILAYSYNGSLIHAWQSSENQSGWTSGTPSIENVLSSGADEVVISYRYPNRTEIFNAQSALPQKVLNYGTRRVTPALADVNNDNHPDILAPDINNGILHAYDAYYDNPIWDTDPIQGYFNQSSPAVGNIHEDYPDEVEITYICTKSSDAKLRLVDRLLGRDLEDWPLDIDDQVWKSSPALAFLQGHSDPYLDIIFSAYDCVLYGVNSDKEPIYPFPLLLFGKPNSVVIGNIDNDRKSETILSSDDGYLHVWTNVNSYCLPHTLEWPQFHHDYQRTGVYGWVGGLRGGDANPKTFSTGTTLSFSLEDTLHIRITVYDAEANPVKTLVNQTLPQGTYHPVWYGKDNNYSFLPNGIYFIEIKVKNESKIIPV
ncbi:hypothetical protein KAX97_04875, partial [candidate division WOR-3 bacterium]|nr:hypothetical protein [candidate division WOR-3 bacterium]